MSEPEDKVADDVARLALMELADAFGVDESAVMGLLPVAMDGRLYAEGGKAVYVLLSPITLADGTKIETVRLREPNAGDYVEYSKGMSVTVKDGATEVNTVMMTRRTIRAVDRLGEIKGGSAIVERFAVRDIRALGEVCDALGFFE